MGKTGRPVTFDIYTLPPGKPGDNYLTNKFATSCRPNVNMVEFRIKSMS